MKNLKITLFGLILSSGILTTSSYGKTRAEALAEAQDRVNERYNVKEAKDIQKAKDKIELKTYKSEQKRRLLEIELEAIKNTVK